MYLSACKAGPNSHLHKYAQMLNSGPGTAILQLKASTCTFEAKCIQFCNVCLSDGQQ